MTDPHHAGGYFGTGNPGLDGQGRLNGQAVLALDGEVARKRARTRPPPMRVLREPRLPIPCKASASAGGGNSGAVESLALRVCRRGSGERSLRHSDPKCNAAYKAYA